MSIEEHPPTILVADDEDDILRLVRFGLERDGYRVLIAADGAGALQAAQDEVPSLCVLDVMMPRLSGLEVLQRLREDPRTEAVRVILLTARGREADVDRGFELGADDYVTKPFSPQELRRRVRAVLGR